MFWDTILDPLRNFLSNDILRWMIAAVLLAVGYHQSLVHGLRIGRVTAGTKIRPRTLSCARGRLLPPVSLQSSHAEYSSGINRRA